MYFVWIKIRQKCPPNFCLKKRWIAKFLKVAFIFKIIATACWKEEKWLSPEGEIFLFCSLRFFIPDCSYQNPSLYRFRENKHDTWRGFLVVARRPAGDAAQPRRDNLSGPREGLWEHAKELFSGVSYSIVSLWLNLRRSIDTNTVLVTSCTFFDVFRNWLNDMRELSGVPRKRMRAKKCAKKYNCKRRKKRRKKKVWENMAVLWKEFRSEIDANPDLPSHHAPRHCWRWPGIPGQTKIRLF